MQEEVHYNQTETMKLFISSHVTKLGTIRAFNLPAIKTCPTRTTECESYCYGTKNRFNWDIPKKYYENNYLLSKNDVFIMSMVNSLSPNERFFRIHTVGDFYSQSYFNKWIAIARLTPHIEFLAYTRNYNLNVSRVPKNLHLIYTIDVSTKKLNPDIKRYTIVGDHFIKDMFVHLTPLDFAGREFLVCNNDNCLECRVCWETNANILFPQKYKRYNSQENITILPTI